MGRSHARLFIVDMTLVIEPHKKSWKSGVMQPVFRILLHKSSMTLQPIPAFMLYHINRFVTQYFRSINPHFAVILPVYTPEFFQKDNCEYAHFRQEAFPRMASHPPRSSL